MADEYEVYLMHYGVKGMRWGVRRASVSATGSATKSSGPRLSAEQRKTYLKAAAKTGLIVGGLAAGPVALAVGGGPIGAIVASTTMRVLNTPEVQGAVKEAAKFSKDLGARVNFDALANAKTKSMDLISNISGADKVKEANAYVERVNRELAQEGNRSTTSRRETNLNAKAAVDRYQDTQKQYASKLQELADTQRKVNAELREQSPTYSPGEKRAIAVLEKIPGLGPKN